MRTNVHVHLNTCERDRNTHNKQMTKDSNIERENRR